jgi:signal transduction histidine kinase
MDMAVVEVQDYGRGIAPEDLPSIFNRFYQGGERSPGQHDGLGLGLSIAKAIVEQHGGAISASSEVGKGSTFTIKLPLADATEK